MARILIVDDEEMLLRSAQRWLKRDFAVETAPHSRSALELLAQGTFDIVFSDNDMEDRDEGIRFLVRVGELYPLVGRFLTSGRLVPSEAVQYRFDGFLPKPYGMPFVIATFRDYLAKRNV